MALNFTPPPDWLIKQYMDEQNRNPAVEGLNAAGSVSQMYMQQKNQQATQKQAALANYLKLLETDPELINTPVGKQLQQQVGGGLGGYQPPSVSTPTASSPQAPVTTGIDGMAPQQTPGPSSTSPIISHFNSLYGRGKMGEKAQGQIKTGLEVQKLEQGMAPQPVMTKSQALSAGTVPANTMIVEPPEQKKPPQTGAQKSADRVFGAEYARYTASGGYADVVGQIQSLEDVLTDLEGGKKNLTGPLISAQPDFTRKRLNPESMASQQAVEQSVQRTLKQTLGGQFTEKEGMLFMQRGYDPALPEAENAKKLRRTTGQLKTMALAKQQAIDYYEENGSLDGYRGDLYTLKNGEMVRTTKDDFYKMMGASGGSGQMDGGQGNDNSGKRKVSNGKETLWIDPADSAEAARDGYRQVP